MALGRGDKRHLQSARGYIELGMFEEANAELEQIDSFCRHLPEVLIAKVAIYRALKKWELMEIVAKRLVEWNPQTAGFLVDWAYAARRAESIHIAHAILTRWRKVFGSPRYYAMVYTAAGEDLAALLVRNGLARIYGTRTPLPDGRDSRQYLAHLAELEQSAKKEGVGGWKRKGAG